MNDSDKDQPISRLDERLDELAVALAKLPDLPGLIEGLEAYEQLTGLLDPDTPGVVDVWAGTDVRRALINVAGEILALQEKKGSDDGGT